MSFYLPNPVNLTGLAKQTLTYFFSGRAGGTSIIARNLSIGSPFAAKIKAMRKAFWIAVNIQATYMIIESNCLILLLK